MTMTDKELDYCNAEGIAPADFIKRKMAAVKGKKKPAANVDNFAWRKKITPQRLADGSFRLGNGLVVDEQLWELINEKSKADVIALNKMFKKWARHAAMVLH